MLRRGLRLLRTVRHLRMSQLIHRMRLRTQRRLMAALPRGSAAVVRRRRRETPGWPSGFRSLQGLDAEGFPSAEDNADGRFEFYGHMLELGSPPTWNPGSVDQLWRFHLHYFDWVWSFVGYADQAWAREQFQYLWGSWRPQARFGRLDAWSPFVASLRLWNMAGAFDTLVAGSDYEEDFLTDIRTHAGFVRWNLELDVGGNHLLKNVKALIGSGIFLRDERLMRRGLRMLRRILQTQVLGDGGHYELSPSYHCQVLEDLIDLRELLVAADRDELPELTGAILKMRAWLGSVLMPGGEIPLLNDSWAVSDVRLGFLDPIPDDDRLSVLAESGYVVVRPRPGTQLVLDVGDPGPRHLAAHSQSDALSFVLSVSGRQVVVDTGVSTYEAGAVRRHERSTRAHNTVEIDGEDQSETWASFRLGRRANVTLLRAEDRGRDVIVSGSHDGYRRLPGSPIHRRTWQVTTSGVTVTDEITGTGSHLVTRRLMSAPTELVAASSGELLVAGCVFEAPTVNGAIVPWVVGASQVGDGRGGRLATTQLCAESKVELPAELVMTIRFPAGEAV